MNNRAEHLCVLIFDENRARASIIEQGLREAGNVRAHTIHDMTRLAAQIEIIAPDVIVIDLENPNRDVLEHFLTISRAIHKPIAMFVDRSDNETMSAAIEAGVSAYVVDGLRKERVKAILDMAITRFNAYARLRGELDAARRALEERKTVERAKGLLMKTNGLSEEEAYQALRRAAMNQGRTIGTVAESILLAADLMKGMLK